MKDTIGLTVTYGAYTRDSKLIDIGVIMLKRTLQGKKSLLNTDIADIAEQCYNDALTNRGWVDTDYVALSSIVFEDPASSVSF